MGPDVLKPAHQLAKEAGHILAKAWRCQDRASRLHRRVQDDAEQIGAVLLDHSSRLLAIEAKTKSASTSLMSAVL